MCAAINGALLCQLLNPELILINPKSLLNPKFCTIHIVKICTLVVRFSQAH